MKRFVSILCSALCFVCLSYAGNGGDSIKERKLLTKEYGGQLDAMAAKTAKKEAKTLTKARWTVSPGQLPLEKQLDKLYKLYYEYDSDGMPSYIIGESRVVSNMYNAARMQALNNAAVEIANTIESEITALTESTVSNNMLSAENAVFISNALHASRSLIIQSLARGLVVLECHRLSGTNTEVCLRVAYKTRNVYSTVEDIVKKQLAADGYEMDDKVNTVWSEMDNL